LSGAKKLIIVPDGILHTLPFQLLVEPGSTPVTNYKDYPYLAKQYAITTYPAAGAFYQLSKPAPQNTGKVLALANPTLQTSATQSNTYSNLVLGKATIAPPAIAVYDAKTQFTPFEAANLTLLQQNQVAETKLKQLSRQPYQYLHLAAPFVFNSQYPQFSGLIVGGTQGNNALLTLPKLAELSPSAALLNLPFAFSHTPSGLQGNAVATLQLTTLQAGIGAATYSLWLPQVSHATQFYTLLYDRLAQNTPLPDAYQHTQLQMMQTDEFAAPAAWAAFTLSGGFAGR
ncbi:MAG TPA: CHAT domain-containing protein, partial [Chitinophagales bacterium]|nr:CHAT domain-containing protein [Chitinophagales bacterium]